MTMNFRAASSFTGLLLLATLVVPSLASFASLASLTAAEKADPGLIAIEVEQAGPDYVVQGEYLSAGKPALGVQVIANGKGTFTAVILPGGLPGAGWDGKTRQELSGQTSGSETTFSGEVGKVVISAGTLTVTGATLVPTTPLKACSVEFAPAVRFVPEPAALKTDPPFALTFTPPPVLSDPSVTFVPAL